MPRSDRSEPRSSSAWQSFGTQLLGTFQSILSTLAVGMVFLLLENGIHPFYSLAFNLIVATVIGLVAGLYVRLVMPKSIRVIQFLAGFTAALIGIIIYGQVLTIMGKNSPFLGLPSWSLLVQVLFSGISVLLIQTAWRKDRLRILRKRAQQRRARRERLLKIRIAARQKRSRRTRAPSPAPSRAVRTSTRPTISRITTARTQPRKRKRSKVTLAAFDEHRCPYCLQEVKVNDPRGVKICRVCGAWHHKDCWDVSGHCQVPHSGNTNA